MYLIGEEGIGIEINVEKRRLRLCQISPKKKREWTVEATKSLKKKSF